MTFHLYQIHFLLSPITLLQSVFVLGSFFTINNKVFGKGTRGFPYKNVNVGVKQIVYVYFELHVENVSLHVNLFTTI